MPVKVIKNQDDYDAALERLEQLMVLDPIDDSQDAQELELLAIVIETYESEHFPIAKPDPVDAIRFRMDQMGLSQKDLIRYIGSPSKVSEVLNRKRPLSLSMIRALHEGLGIPSDILIQSATSPDSEESGIEWEKFPIAEMMKRGWLSLSERAGAGKTVEVLRTFFATSGDPFALSALYRKTDHVRSARSLDLYALAAWKARVLQRAAAMPLTGTYSPNSMTREEMGELVRLSWSEQGPTLAREFLAQRGIPLVVEPHLPKTQLDGAVIVTETGPPVIGLTLRYDRVDNFWFTLMHELAHVCLHVDQEKLSFFDADLEEHAASDALERAADALAGDVLIPSKEWEESIAKVLRSPEAAEDLAKRLRIHPAIVAGRMRHESKNYRILSQLVGTGQVRRHFPDVNWSESK